MASMQWRMSDTHQGEAQAILDAYAKITKLKKSFQTKIKDLNIEADYQTQWFWDELNSARSENDWL